LSYSDDDKAIINGDHTISQSGIYEAAGATFDYQRIDGITNNSTSNYRKMEGVTEWITCTGRITETIQLKVLSRDKNPGIKYEYLLPINNNFEFNSDENYDYTSAETELPPLSTVAGQRHTLKSGTVTATPMNVTRERRRRRFMWKVVDFHPCNKSCGGGIQTPIYHCVKEGPSKRFLPKRCAHLAKPILSDSVLKCNTQPCPAYWKISEWSSCQCTGYNDTGFQKREIKCVQELGTGMVIQIPVGACLDERPDGRQLCECPKNKQDTYKYRVSPGGFNSIKHRVHHSKIPILNDDNNNVPSRPDHRNRKSGVWLASEWIEQCTTQCGEGIQYRSIFCDRSPPNIERCDIRLTPDTTRQCTATEKCDIGEWFIGSWSQCTGDCFNLTQSRTIYCIKDGNIVDDAICANDQKPVSFQKCNISQVPECGPSWHYSEWSDCSRPCGTGLQKRSIKCLRYEPIEGEMKESDSCRHKKRKRASQQCNTHSCDSTTTEPAPDPQVDLIQNDIAPECKDELSNCLFAVKQQLCNWPYIKEQCCETCFYKS
ncbi:Thrombospondin type-1 domain-containing protein 4, partial [Pseudolycoriella hygida]